MSDAAEPLTEQNERPASSPDHQPETGRESETGRAGAHVWLMALAGSCEDAIIGRDAGGEITLWNEAAEVMFGYPAADIVGQPGTCLIPPDRIDDEAEIFGRVRRGEKIRRPQTTRQRRDGTIVAVSLIISPVRDDHGTIVGSCEVATGIGRRDEHGNKLLAENGRLRRLAQELAASRAAADRANQAKSGFLAGMSHELRTPLNSILGYARLLRLEGGLNATQTARVDALLKAGEHLLHVIAGALDLARIEAGQMERQSVPVDVQAVATACLGLLRPAADAKGLSLGFAMAPGTPAELIGDPVRLRQVLVNLLDNAVKYTDKGTVELRLGLTPDGSAVRMEVADTGRGIPADQRHRLFHEFVRLDTAAASAVEGSGIGLALSARLAALMGGRLGHDDRPGGGSLFWLELPLDTALRSAPPLPAAKVATRSAALHVLLADDVAMNRDITSALLRAAGHSVTCAEGGAEAVALAAGTDFDVVLMDVRMPGVDGLAAARLIRQTEGPRGLVPIVALTAQAFSDQIEACRMAGMDSHLSKPFELDTLLTTIAVAAAGRPMKAASVIPPDPPLSPPDRPR